MGKNSNPRFRERLIVFILIGITGLVTAYVCFGLLKSSADGKYKDYSVGGAIAGALFSWMILLYMYSRLRKPDDDAEMEELRRRNEELQQKLIKGAPRPAEFSIEVAETQRIVLARPKEWEPRGGVLFDFEETERDRDKFPSRFTLYYIPIKEKDKQTADVFYTQMIKTFEDSPVTANFKAEFITIGGDPYGIKSLKVISEECIAMRDVKDPVSEKPRKEWWHISKAEYDKFTDQGKTAGDAKAPVDPSVPVAQELSYMKVARINIICYNTDLMNIFNFNFWDNSADFTKASEQFNKIISSVRFLN